MTCLWKNGLLYIHTSPVMSKELIKSIQNTKDRRHKKKTVQE